MSSMKNLTKKLILIIDDSADNQDLLKVLLEAHGFEVQCASNGAEALSLLNILSILPSLILLDIQMPTMDGYSFRSEQVRTDRLKNIPVVIMTGNEDKDIQEKMHFPQGILTKPLKVDSIINTVVRFIQ